MSHIGDRNQEGHLEGSILSAPKQYIVIHALQAYISCVVPLIFYIGNEWTTNLSDKAHRLHVWYICVHLDDFRASIGKYSTHGASGKHKSNSIQLIPGHWLLRVPVRLHMIARYKPTTTSPLAYAQWLPEVSG